MTIYTGNALDQSSANEYSRLDFVVRQITGGMATSGLARVVAVDTTKMRVDVNPLVHQIDGTGKPTPHGVIHNLPYLRLQGGSGGVIIDPAVGDIGIVVYASTDISSVKNTRKPGGPGSRRRFSMADGLYLGGVLNAAPTSYILIDPAGNITAHSPGRIVLNAPDVQTSGTLETAGTITVTGGDVVADGLSLKAIDARLRRIGG